MSRRKRTPNARLPGDPTRDELVADIIRVDHAGEYGAVRIYEGQLRVLVPGAAADAVGRMAEQEREHLRAFEQLMVSRRVRPSALLPLWHVAGFALGAATALLGKRAAMACTVAVEEVIDGHYRRQTEALGDEDRDLRETIERFRRDEAAHREEGLAHGARMAPGYPLLAAAIKAGSRLAIRLSTRI